MLTLITVRHGETEWSRTGRHTGKTDLPLTARGEEQARLLGRMLAGRDVAAAWVSPARRARRTAELAGLHRVEIDPNLSEWDYGAYEGRTTAEIREQRPGWYLWRDGVLPGDADHPGETVDQVGARADAVLQRVRQQDGDVVLVSHGHFLRVLAARWLGLDAGAGRLFRLDTATVSLLGTEHGYPTINRWNVSV